MKDLLPVCREDMERRGWKQLDFLLITGDAYVDHPTFANGLIARWMEYLGWKIGVVAQPDWRSRKDFEVMGRPRLAAFVSAGNLDSMLNKLTASRNRRGTDSYSPGGELGHRPDRATLVYCNRVREIWGDIPLVIGGIEASMRRFAHYDYWSDKVRRPMLADAKADILIYGMGELQLKEIAALLGAGVPVGEIDSIPGTCVMKREKPENCVEIPSYEAVVSDKRSYAEAFRLQSMEQDPFRGKTVVQKVADRYMVQNRPMRPLTTAEFDLVNELPYTREPHKMYASLGGIPAAEEVRFSINSTRGCFGSCAFCAIHAHQGRIVQARSQESILREARELTTHKNFKGYIHDVGGPTGNFRGPACPDQLLRGCCKNRECLFPSPCPHMKPDHSEFIDLLRKLRALPGVKKVFIRSGLRYDYILADPNGDRFIEELCRYHVSGQLRVAPEHASPKVLRLMGKPPIEEYLRFKERFESATKRAGKEQYVLPYLISSHPGCSLKEAVELAEFLRDQKFTPNQVQDFIPTPGSLSTCMFYTGLNPMTGEKVYVPRGGHEKSMQRALLQYRRPENRALVIEALKRAGREDLIGWGPHCLVHPDKKVFHHREEKRRADTRALSARGRRKDEPNARKRAR
ncbi:MAG: YgiQ family radical SAM protein [Pyramidobacter sp.]|jgi:uncharacterized radical SAM protein YgiQ